MLTLYSSGILFVSALFVTVGIMKIVNQTSESYSLFEDSQELINYRLHKFVKEIDESDDESDNSEEDFVEAESE